MTHYETLGLTRSASQEEIAEAYRKLAVKFHPDANGGDEKTNQRFGEITAAYDVLIHPESRTHYDKTAHRMRINEPYYHLTTPIRQNDWILIEIERWLVRSVPGKLLLFSAIVFVIAAIIWATWSR